MTTARDVLRKMMRDTRAVREQMERARKAERRAVRRMKQ